MIFKPAKAGRRACRWPGPGADALIKVHGIQEGPGLQGMRANGRGWRAWDGDSLGCSGRHFRDFGDNGEGLRVTGT